MGATSLLNVGVAGACARAATPRTSTAPRVPTASERDLPYIEPPVTTSQYKALDATALRRVSSWDTPPGGRSACSCWSADAKRLASGDLQGAHRKVGQGATTADCD